MMQLERLRLTPLLLPLIFLATAAFATVSDPSEADFAESVIAFQLKDYPTTLRLLDAMIASNPGNRRARELRALALKSSGDTTLALRAYEDLARRVPSNESGPYDFEAGVLLAQAKRYPEAKSRLTRAVDRDFNVPAANFFLGQVSMETGDGKEAEKRFRAVLDSDVELLHPTAHYYLGILAERRSNQSAALASYLRARDSARPYLEDAGVPEPTRRSARQITDAVTAALGRQDGGGFFANVGLITGYDSNVLLIPTGQASGQSTFLETLRYGLGYTGGMIGGVQVTPLYQGSFNYNFNRSASAGQYLTQNVSLYATAAPLAPTSYGVRTDFTYVMRNTSSDDSAAPTLAAQSVSLGIGPFIRTEIAPRETLSTEILWQPQKFYTDATLSSDLQKTGYEVRSRTSYQRETGGALWNPGAELSLVYQRTQGEEFRAIGADLDLFDGINLSDRTRLVGFMGLAYFTFGDRPAGVRRDLEGSLGTNFTYRWTDAFRINGGVQYVYNLSNVKTTYEYSRASASLGGDYRF